MTFNPNIPQASDLISQSQAQILTNFGQVNTIFDIDHVTFNNATAANRGKHDKSTYVEQASDPVTSTNEVAVYSKDTGTQPDLFYRPESAGTAVRLTGGGLTAAAWVRFNVSGAVITVLESYNVSSVSITGANGVVTINFSRVFANTNYAALINAIQTGSGDNVNRKVNLSAQTTAAYSYNVTATTGGVITADSLPVVNAVFFGTLA